MAEARPTGAFASLRSRLIRLVLRRPLWLLGLLFLLGTVVLIAQLQRLSNQLIEANALQGARILTSALTEFRTLYTSEVVEPLRDHHVLASHDYQQRSKAIPLPATLTIMLGERIDQLAGGTHAALYSPYPFPWRTQSGGLRDEFNRAAWSFLNEHPEQSYSRIEPVDGRPTLRYATADRMRAACVGCHNSHADSPRRNWQVGDVRGVLEVTRPLDVAQALASAQLRSTFLLMMGLLLLLLALLDFVLRRLRASVEQAEGSAQASLAANAELLLEIERRQRSEQATLLASQQVERYAADLLQANRAKSLFLANMSHELRTPLNAILGYTQVLRRRDGDVGQDAGMLQTMESSGRQLLGLINDVLDLSRLDAGAMAVHAVDFDLTTLAQDMAARFAPRCHDKGLSWKLTMAINCAAVNGDAAKLRQILISLLANAVKFTEKGEVSLRLSQPAAEIYEFEISDTGAGMSGQTLAQIFAPFFQSGEGAKKGGTGLGLVLTQKQLELMGSRLIIASVPDGGCCCHFQLRLPSAQAEPVPAVVPIETIAVVTANAEVTEAAGIPTELYRRLLTAVEQGWISGTEQMLGELANSGVAGCAQAARLDAFLRNYDMAGLSRELQRLIEQREG